MKNFPKFLFLPLLFTLLLPSCTDDFEELNRDPNRVENVTPANLLSPVLYDALTVNLNRNHRINNEIMQVTVTRSSSNGFHRYVIRPGESDYFWDNYYRQLNNVQDLYDLATETNQPEYAAAALVLKSWIFSLLTDLFGDVPYSQALLGLKEGNFQPAFDPQAGIYAGLLGDLERANELLSMTEGFAAGGDILYDGDPVKWKKFANSLRLRLLMRAARRPEINAAGKIAEMVADPAKYPLFAGNEDAAVLAFTDGPPLLNPFTNWRNYDFNGERGYTQFFIGNLNRWNDPRLPVWATAVSKKYVGLPSGYPVAEAPAVNALSASTYHLTLKTAPTLGIILPYAEVEFLLAEAALKGYIAGDAKTHYDKGVQAALEYWQVEMPADFLAREGVAFNGTLESIMLQKYYALLFTDYQQWFEYRRTGLPALPKGTGLENGGLMPSRLKYPTLVQSVNGMHYQEAAARIGGDDMNSKVWWEQ